MLEEFLHCLVLFFSIVIYFLILLSYWKSARMLCIELLDVIRGLKHAMINSTVNLIE